LPHRALAGNERRGLDVTTTAERKARNEAVFRDANEEIKAVRDRLSLVDGKTPFFCECEDTTCREVLRLGLDEYEQIRSQPTTFLIARGHPHTAGRVVSDRGTYMVVEKQGAAARVARDSDPRSNDG
jgi:hypothetical protein